MKSPRRIWAAAAALALGACLAGCSMNRGIYATYEERYRLFFIKDQANPLQLASDPAIAAKSFGPMASLNLGFEDLASEGFELSRVEAVGDGGGATKFTFRRRIPEWYHPTKGPMEMLGIFATEADEEKKAPITYYIFDPIDRGYLLHMQTESEEKVMLVAWDGFKAKWREGSVDNEVTLSPDGRSVFHRMTDMTPDFQIASDKTIEAVRIVPKR